MSIAHPERVVNTGYDLEIARQLVTAGVPLVFAYDKGKGAFTLEKQWHLAEPDERKLDDWLNGKGDLLAAVCGHVYDVFDFDPQNGGELEDFLRYFAQGHRRIRFQAAVRTPSGGYHLYVNTLNQRKRSWPGVDYQGQRSFVFIPPSRKLSKRRKELVSYRWLDYSPGGKDDGEAILASLSKWPDPGGKRIRRVRDKITVAGSKLRLSVDDVRSYQFHGIPEDLNHDDTLKDVVWLLCLWNVSEQRSLVIWQDIVDSTPPKGGKRPYDPERDFPRMWNGAVSKLRNGRREGNA